MSDTPLTDREAFFIGGPTHPTGTVVGAWLARGLERDLARYRAALERIAHSADKDCPCCYCQRVREVKASLEVKP